MKQRLMKLSQKRKNWKKKLAALEFRRMFSGQHDNCDCYVDLQAGSGGTEAQDWTEMLLRMYLRWAESKGFKTRFRIS